VNKSTASLVFQSTSYTTHPDLKTYYPEVSTLGKHFTFAPVDKNDKYIERVEK
jgi:hypothetical protein